MKYELFFLAACLALAFSACVRAVEPDKTKPAPAKKAAAKEDLLHDELQPAVTDTLPLGDLDRDGKPDTAFVFTPRTIASVKQNGEVQFVCGCENGDCYNTVRFSCELPELRREESVWGTIENTGDLDKDGFAELIFCPGWFTSSMTHLYLYSLKAGTWKKIAEVSYRRADVPEPHTHIVRKKGKYYLRGILFDGDDTPCEVPIAF